MRMNELIKSIAYSNDDIQSVGRSKQGQDQQVGLPFASTITYFLWEGKSRDGISEGVYTLQAQSPTGCGKAKAGMGSVRGSALCKHNHIQPVRRQRQG